MKYILIGFIAISALLSGWLLSSFTNENHPKEVIQVNTQIVDVNDTHQQSFVRVFDMFVTANTHYKNIDFGFVYTSFILEMIDNQTIANVKYTSHDKEITVLNGSSNSDLSESRNLSTFVVPNQPQSTMNLYTGSVEGKIRVYLLYAPPINIDYKKSLHKATDSCNKPSMILGTTWRKGLPDPIGTREPTSVNHNVVHHAASSNNNHDYVNVVRNIYLLHTQSNGWDDIGYNFLVAQDGSIFEGRDPQGAGDIDNIKGAHFCGKNSNTMGICMLGNYQEIAPTDSSIASLKHLLLWKCVKSGIDPTATLPHPDANSAKLNCVAGHRDGCATACPGDSMYRLLPDIRSELFAKWQACGGHVSSRKLVSTKAQILVYTQQGRLIVDSKDILWDKAQIFDLTGKLVGSFNRNEIIAAPISGRYVMVFQYNNIPVARNLFQVYQ